MNKKQVKERVDSHGLTPVALKKNELANFSFGIHPRAHARGPLLISIAEFARICQNAENDEKVLLEVALFVEDVFGIVLSGAPLHQGQLLRI